ncbi:MAG: chromosome segregation protein SMC [Planctomycetota bacterium]
MVRAITEQERLDEHAGTAEPIDDTTANESDDAIEADASGDIDLAAIAAMRLRKLTLVGFKSFADKTELTFDQAITCVVGPNGCGKSNIVDAIKWVLGERSSKSLRGKEMLDVIFAGSAGRKPGGMASVGLTFDNPTIESGPRINRRPLPIDADEVTVERQLYRDGTSRYVINGRRARLKDVRDLFLDTGIGADAYSIIEQGKVDAMLLSSPQERRVIFEEAAGIAKYKVRRIEAQRKLDRTNQNLQRTRDLLDSTERRLRMVRGQAAKAREFQRLDAEYQALRALLAFDAYASLRTELDDVVAELETLSAQRETAHAALGELEAQRRDAEVTLAESQEALRSVEDRLKSAEHAASVAQQRRQMAERSIEETARSVEAERERVASERSGIEKAESELDEQSQLLASLTERRAEAEAEVERLDSLRAEALEKIAHARGAAADAGRRLAEMERERASLETRIEGETRSLTQIAERIDRLDAKSQELSTRQTEIEQALEQAWNERAELEERVASTEAAIESLDERATGLGTDRAARASALRDLEQESARLDSRRATLDEMQQQRVGLGEAAREAMRRREEGEGFSAVIAPLAELIETESRHAAAVEAAIGQDLDALVLAHAEALPEDEELATLPGRVRFAPIETFGGKCAEPDALGPIATMLAARVARVRQLVRVRDGASDGVEALLDRLLAGVVLVPTLESAMLLASGPLAGQPLRYVTEDGCVLDERGGVTAGPASEGGGVLGRAAELADLEERLTNLNTRIETERTALAGLDEQSAAIATDRKAKSDELKELRRSFNAAASAVERGEHDAKRVESDLAAIDGDRGELNERRAGLEEQLASLTDRRGKLEGLITEQRTAHEDATATVEKAEQAASASGDQLSAARAESSKVGEQASAARRELHRLEAGLDSAKRRLGEHERHLADIESRSESYRNAAQEAAEAHETAVTEAETARGELGGAREAYETARTVRESLSGEYKQRSTAAREADDAWNTAERIRHGLDVKREQVEQRTIDDLSIDLAAEIADFREAMAEGVEDFNRDDAKRDVKELRSAIKKLGNVNLDSIEEETTLAGKNETLAAEVEDLDTASAQLRDLIEKLNHASRERFGTAFAAIQEGFGGQNGMFRKLFGGGRAEVRLMPLVKEIDGEKVQTDEIDLLDSGIEVIAKPPGKEPRSISQLSGGEKTLTAVALLMSIFRSKPSCFCVLDEVDAALDEANVGRFVNVVREFTDRSRFIVITHNKRTMQMADHMYGITQQEKGVSKRVSVRFDQVNSDGSFKASKEQLKQDAEVEAKPEKAARPSEALRSN